MPDIFKKLLILAILGGLGLAHAQEMPAWLQEKNVPPPPAEHVVDEAGFFSQDPGKLEEMRTAVKRLEREHGFKIYVWVKSVFIDSSAQLMAGRLQEAWVPDGGGIVLVYETDSRSLGLGRGYEGDVTQPDQRAILRSHEMVEIISRTMDRTDKSLAPEKYVSALTLQLVKECRDHFIRREAPAPGGRGARIAVLVLGTLALLSLVALGLGVVVRQSGARAPKCFGFPHSSRPLRLGAPFGGGMVAVKKFGSRP